ncbi:glycosyltransferase family 2 protein [Candidatus Microgenomates bacterium]|jgi:GT2 family glycosyltransferase|nr:MAG: glycosyltransferase family 2 protein [Candidatus Microgenomates bacterium]
MEKREIKLSIIIVNWNTRELLRKCLESVISDQLSAISYQRSVISKNKKPVTDNQSLITEIIVVDNGSTDGSVEYLRELIDNSLTADHRSPITLRLIENKENLGFSKGNNIALRQAQGEYIMLLNSDTIVKEGAIQKLVEYLDNNPEVDIVGPKLLNKDGTLQANCGRFPNLDVAFVMLFKEHLGGSEYVRCSPESSGPVDWLMGAAFVARKKVFDKVGGLDETIFMYMEEVEWFYRAKKAGFKAYFLKEAEIIHLGRGSAKSGKKDPILNIYKGMIHYYKKHKSFLELAILRLMLKLKALAAFLLGCLKNDSYLKETYGEALKIN